MEDYDKIYKRIHERKKIEQDKPIKEKKDKKPKSEKKRSFKIINRILGLICLLMAFLIYAYKDPNAKLINQIFNTNISTTYIIAPASIDIIVEMLGDITIFSPIFMKYTATPIIMPAKSGFTIYLILGMCIFKALFIAL